MTLDQLCAQLDANGVKITVVDGKLRIDAPAGALSEGLRAGLVEHKAALLGRLAGGVGPTVPTMPTVPTLSGDRAIKPQVGTGEVFRIPLNGMCEWLAEHKLRVVGGDPAQQRLYLADM